MSAKKKAFVEKGLVVAVFLVMAVVGVVIAQSSIIHPYRIGNAGAGLAAESGVGTAALGINLLVMNEPLHANLLAIPNMEHGMMTSDEYVWGDPSPDGTGIDLVGNAGYLIVETNFEKWDILVSTKNGGYLKRSGAEFDAATEESDLPLVPTISDWKDSCTQVTPPALIEILGTECMNTVQVPIYEENADPGKYLRSTQTMTGGQLAYIGLNIGIGTVGGFTSASDFITILPVMIEGGMAEGDLGEAESYVEITDRIKFPLAYNASMVTANPPAATDPDWKGGVASLAREIGNAVANEVGYDWDGTGFTGTANADQKVSATGQYVATNISGTSAPTLEDLIPGFYVHDGLTLTAEIAAIKAVTSDENYFTDVKPFDATTTDGTIIGITQKMFPPNKEGMTIEQQNHRAMVFYINATLDIDDANYKISQSNKNGNYTEDLIFTFWGTY